MKKFPRQSLPVLMHHSISDDATQVAIRTAVFDEQCRMLAENGWFGISLAQAEAFLINGESLPEKSFLMTFDDGFLDNYVHAWPIMRKYGHKGVIFAVTDRITQAQRDCEAQTPAPGPNASGLGASGASGPDDADTPGPAVPYDAGASDRAGLSALRPTIRPTLEDVWQGRCAREDLPNVDSPLREDALGRAFRQDLFFTWDEARLMEQSGVVAIAAHSARHERVFAGPAFSGFAQPGDRLRTFSYTVSPTFWGMPVFAREPELAQRAFIPSPALLKAIASLVPQDDAAAAEFFASPPNLDRLSALVEQHKNRLGEYESPEDRTRRLRAVMETCQATLTRELGHPIQSFCWPWGVFCDQAREQAQDAGFTVFYTTRLGLNLPARPLAVNRIKVKSRTDSWLLRRLNVYSRPWLGFLYLALRL